MRSGPERVVLRAGSGPALVCLPFAGGSARSFVRLARCAPEGWRVVGVQPPVRRGAYGMELEELARFYLGLLAEDLGGPALVLGHSLGAAVANRLAALAPGHLLDDTQFVLSAPPAPGDSSRELLRLDDRALLAEATRRGILPRLDVPEDLAVRLLLPDLRADLSVLGRQGWKPEPVDAPLHLLGGSEDTACPPGSLSVLRDMLAPRSTHVIEGAHLFVVDQPERTMRALCAVGGHAEGSGP
ncbi:MULTISPECIES: thioesterase II family protein [unclassified Streptomyces]|uniref:thioesterase II family protein n=1 Tax=unclassified Streptomyces TaxID=2593676 RepID=UPI0022B6C8B3|nr:MULTISPECIES: alpha/beta fold hydrolase [unclassified Streptomyces]MCZ7416006.1 alpha/beta fold hydrolase [Streptomyces sp. WMMC897]MCZ7434187.1 alpha/beta fold hydrolase [Streptomyces sp. WMMC1477]